MRPTVAGPEVLSGICASIALRDLNLIDSLLAMLETMEAREDNPDTLAELYRIDHLATRLRRNAENLRLLAGWDDSDVVSETMSLADVMRAAMSAIDQYARVTVGQIAAIGVIGFAANDLSRLLAELLDNATKNSPPSSTVRASAHLTEQGSVLIRIEDDGIGLPVERVSALNDRLTASPKLDNDAVRHMGLAVVRRIASRHDLRVWLDRRAPHGTTVSVVLPASLICEIPAALWSGASTVVFARVPVTKPEEDHQSVGSTSSSDEPRPAGFHQVSATEPIAAPSWSSPTKLSGSRPTPVSGGVTSSGLPRRVPRSLRRPVDDTSTTVTPAESLAATNGSVPDYTKLIDDLGAFSAGERSARDVGDIEAQPKETTSDGKHG